MSLTREQIETMRGVLRGYWEKAGHSPEAPDALCDMALSSIRSEKQEHDADFYIDPREWRVYSDLEAALNHGCIESELISAYRREHK